MIDTHKPEVRYPGMNRFFNYTMGGLPSYYAEIEILTANGYDSTSHVVTDRDGTTMTVVALYREGQIVKVYEL